MTGVPERSDRDLAALVADPSPTPSPPAGDLASPYLRLRRLHAERGDDTPLLADHARLRTLLELSAMADPSLFFAMFLHHCMAMGAALDQGADQADVAELASGRWIGGALLAELGHGNSNSRTHTQAVYDPATREFVLSTPVAEAAKYPATAGAAGIARLAVVSARLLVDGTDRGTALFLVALRDEDGPCPGVTIEPRPPTALLPLDYATVRFDRVRVPYRRWLADGATIAEDGSFHDPLGGPEARSRRSMSMGRFGWGAITAGLAAVARASSSLALTRARRRRTLDRLAGNVAAIDHLNQQRLLFGALAAALAATAIARRDTERCWTIPGAGAGAGLSAAEQRELGLNKVTVSVLADAAVNRCRSASGAVGFFSENRLIGYQGLTMAFQSAGGDNRLILMDAAWAMATDPDHLPPQEQAAPDEWGRLLRGRERLLHAELTAGLRADRVDGTVPFDVWNDRTELAQRYAETHAARGAAEILHAEWHAPTLPEESRPLLADLYELHCVEQVGEHAGWYLARGLLTAEQVLGLPERANEICRRLLRHTDALDRLLEVPEGLLGDFPDTA
ncbi:acyl-CoA dehydrogenase [Actinosynnema sp. NPDC002837]